MDFYDETLKINENTVVLDRTYYPDVTMGMLHFPDGTEIDSIELPWNDNQTSISCIPEGKYAMRMRHSGVVSRSSGGKYTSGWEVCDVPDRTYIMVHPGNTVDDFRGCIGVGMEKGWLGGKRAVLSSRDAFDILMELMEEFDEWELIVREAQEDE